MCAMLPCALYGKLHNARYKPQPFRDKATRASTNGKKIATTCTAAATGMTIAGLVIIIPDLKKQHQE